MIASTFFIRSSLPAQLAKLQQEIRATLANLLLNRAAVSVDLRPHAEIEAWLEEAEEHLRRALPIATVDRPKLRFRRALALYRLGRLEEAKEQAAKLAGKRRLGPQEL